MSALSIAVMPATLIARTWLALKAARSVLSRLRTWSVPRAAIWAVLRAWNWLSVRVFRSSVDSARICAVVSPLNWPSPSMRNWSLARADS